MFDGGVPEQIHRFIASPPPPPPPLPPHQPAAERSLPFPVSFTTFNTNHQTQHMLSLDSRKIIHHHHHHHHHDIKDGTTEWIGHTDHDSDNHLHHHHHHPWCSDEVLALLRFRSTVENWFPEFTWEHTSRKLAEVGFKRSPQECKEKFEEEERRYFNSNNNTNDHQHISNYNNKGNSTYRIFSEVEEFYHHGNGEDHVSSEVGDNQNKRNNSLERKGNMEETGQELMEEDKRDQDQGQVEEPSMEDKINSIDVGKVGNVEDDAKSSSSSIMKDKKKRKRKKEKERFDVLKGFCEGLVRNMIAQQEEMHKKLLEDMVKKEEEKVARDEAWKKQEMERQNKEVEIRAQEQAMASDRNTNIIKFISKFTDHDHDVQSPTSLSQELLSLALPQTQGRRKFQTISSLLPQTLTPHNPLTNDKSLEPTSTKTLKTKNQNPKPPKSDDKSDLGKRWPKDEVLALINIRRSISSINDDDYKDGNSLSSSPSSKAVPLWERISKKMLEVGYKRSAKRCKEKWENINKYFRKTKDVNKKRPLDSRTCPYFHQLTALYSQPSTGTTTTTTVTATSAGDLETRPEEKRVGSGDPDIHVAMHVDADGAGEKSNVQFSGFDLEF